MHNRRIYHQWACWIWASSSSASLPATVGLISGSCSSARIFAPRFFWAPPRGECYFTLALRYDFTSIRLSKGLSPSSCRTCSAHTELPSAGSRGVQGLSIGNRPSSAICSPSCSSMYSRTISSVVVPELTAKDPRAQKCRLQNFLLQVRKLLQPHPRAYPLKPLHDLAYLLMRAIGNEHVYVIACDLAGNNLQFVFRRDLPYQVAHTNRDFPSQHRLPILRDPHQVHLQVALRVRSQSVMSHATTLYEILLRLKARGFHHPRRGH